MSKLSYGGGHLGIPINTKKHTFDQDHPSSISKGSVISQKNLLQGKIKPFLKYKCLNEKLIFKHKMVKS